MPRYRLRHMWEKIVVARDTRFDPPSQYALEQRARRAARRVGLMAKKSRWRITIDNHGGFMLVEPRGNYPVGGFRFDMTADDVVTYCDGE
jgi:hypothetical protein